MNKEAEKKITSRELKAKETRSKIIEYSTKLFLEKGFKGVTISDILKTTGLSKGAFYHHFSSKEELFVELMQSLIDEFAEIPYDTFDNSSLYNFYVDYINHLTNKPEKNVINSFQYTTLLYDAMKIIPDLRNRIKVIKDTEEKNWLNVVRNARENGEIDTPMGDEQITRMFLASSSGVGMNQSSIDDGDRKSILIDLWNAFYNGLKKEKGGI